MLCVLRKSCSLEGCKLHEKFGDMKGNSVSVPCLHSGGQDQPTHAIPSSLTKQEPPRHLHVKYLYQGDLVLPIHNY